MVKSLKPQKWIKIAVALKPGVDSKHLARNLTLKFEHTFSTQHLYYARYTTLESSSFEISAQTRVGPTTEAEIRQNLKRWGGKDVQSVKIEDRGTGSLAHAFAYQAVKNIPAFAPDLAEDNQFLDVIHWMCNMRGLDYMREARLYCFGALRLTHQQAVEAQKNFDAMRKFNSKAKSDDLIERLNLLAGKGQEWAKEPKQPAPQPKRKKPAPAAFGKASAVPHPKPAGSNHLALTGRRSGRVRLGK